MGIRTGRGKNQVNSTWTGVEIGTPDGWLFGILEIIRSEKLEAIVQFVGCKVIRSGDQENGVEQGPQMHLYSLVCFSLLEFIFKDCDLRKRTTNNEADIGRSIRI